VKIKKIAGGTCEDSVYIEGVVATKNVAHKKMNQTIHNPKILILKFALEYERVENQFLSLEPVSFLLPPSIFPCLSLLAEPFLLLLLKVLSEEKNYLKILIGKIAALQPHIVLVEKTVSRVAQDMLLENDITLVKKVKPSVLEAVSRSTGAAMLHSIDQLEMQPKLGSCRLIQVVSFPEPTEIAQKKTVVIFEGGNPEVPSLLLV